MTTANKQGGFIAGAAISRGWLIMLDATNNYPYVVKTAADTDFAIGVATADAASGEAVQCEMLDGNVHTVYGTATEGAEICPDGGNDGYVKDAASGDQICGIAMEAATATHFRALLRNGGLKA